MGKYTKILERLKLARLGLEPKQQEKVNVVKDEIRRELGETLSSSSLSARYEDVRTRIDRIKLALKPYNLEKAALEQLIDDQFETEDLSNLTLAGRGRVEVQREPFAKQVDKDRIREWAVKTGLERMLAIPWNTLNSHVKELLVIGAALPPGVELYTRATVKFARSKDNAVTPADFPEDYLTKPLTDEEIAALEDDDAEEDANESDQPF